MRKIISDFDGVWISVEFARAVRWYLAAMRIRNDPEITEDFITRIAQSDESVRSKLEHIVEDRKNELSVIQSFSGKSISDYVRITAARLGVKISDPLFRYASSVQQPLIHWFAKPACENLAFFSRVTSALSHTYWDHHPLGLVTQSKSETVLSLLRSTLSEFPFLEKLLGPYEKGRGFRYAECVGDHKNLFPNTALPKALGYNVLCDKLGVRPSETIGFEDTPEGVAAAKAAGIACIAIAPPGRECNFMNADLVIQDSLRALTPFADVFVWADPKQAVTVLRERLRTS